MHKPDLLFLFLSLLASGPDVPASMGPDVCVPLQRGGQTQTHLHREDHRGDGEAEGFCECMCENPGHSLTLWGLMLGGELAEASPDFVGTHVMLGGEFP